MTTAGKGLRLFLWFPRNGVKLSPGSASFLQVERQHLTTQHGRPYQDLTKTSGQLTPRTHLLHRKKFKLDPNETPVAT